VNTVSYENLAALSTTHIKFLVPHKISEVGNEQINEFQNVVDVLVSPCLP
jgi:hypothetical protein